jgi:hypothetical protein
VSSYAKIWSTLAKRAVRQGGVNAEAFMELAAASGMSAEEVERRLIEDLSSDGPIFGQFFRQLGTAATGAVLAAESQGSLVAMVDADEELQRLLDIESLDDVIDAADPEALEQIEQAIASRAELTWVATLTNTCYRCLPLHGQTRTLEEWRELGFSPETIHEGWASACNCQLVPTDDAGPREDLIAPLVRLKVEGEKGVKRTARAVAQVDMEKAIQAARKASESEQGRRTLRLLGQSGGTPEEKKRAAG